MLEVGTVSTAARTAISALKAIPGLNIGASALNAVIAGSIVAGMGEGTIRIFERIYQGEHTIDDVEWAQKALESHLSREFVEKATGAIAKASGSEVSNVTGKEQRKALAKLLTKALLSGAMSAEDASGRKTK